MSPEKSGAIWSDTESVVVTDTTGRGIDYRVLDIAHAGADLGYLKGGG